METSAPSFGKRSVLSESGDTDMPQGLFFTRLGGPWAARVSSQKMAQHKKTLIFDWVFDGLAAKGVISQCVFDTDMPRVLFFVGRKNSFRLFYFSSWVIWGGDMKKVI